VADVLAECVVSVSRRGLETGAARNYEYRLAVPKGLTSGLVRSLTEGVQLHLVPWYI